MKSRVEWDGKTSAIAIDWQEFVTIPASQGYFIQAFASADAILDDSVESMLRQIYSSFESQNLINHIHGVRGRVSFDGSAIFLILKNKNAIDQKLYDRVVKFKQARNLVLHNIEAEYKLVELEELVEMKNQETYDNEAKSKAQTALSLAFGVFSELHEISGKIVGHEQEYLLSGLKAHKKAK